MGFAKMSPDKLLVFSARGYRLDTAGDDPLKAFHLVPDTVESTTSRSMFLLAQSTMVPLKSNASNNG